MDIVLREISRRLIGRLPRERAKRPLAPTSPEQVPPPHPRRTLAAPPPPPHRAPAPLQVLCMPIYGQAAAEGEAPPILGVAQCLNKRDGKNFTLTDPNANTHPNAHPSPNPDPHPHLSP